MIIGKIATTVLVLALNGAPVPTPANRVASAALTVAAPRGEVEGRFTLFFEKPARVYYPDRFGLAPTASYWLRIEFKSTSGETFYLVPAGAVPKWPTKDDVKTIAAGDKMVVNFRVSPELGFGLRSANNEDVDRLPVGKYTVSGGFFVDDDIAVRECKLTVFHAEAPPVELVVQ